MVVDESTAPTTVKRSPIFEQPLVAMAAMPVVPELIPLGLLLKGS